MPTLDNLSKIIAKITHGSAESITLETALKDIKADSLHWVQIIIAVETTFDIEVDIDKMRGFTTIGDFTSYIDDSTK
jgi:acyl carrier protein